MSSELRWTLVVVVLAVAGVVAFWPRGDAPPEAPRDGSELFARVPAASEVSRLRRQAALEPCPAAAPDAPAASGPLAGVTVPCLGARGSVDLGAALAGRAALLNVWASWCGPCRAEIPALNAYAARPDAIPVLGVNVLDEPTAALHLLDRLGADYPSVSDPDQELRRALGAPPALPVSYLLRPDGTVQPMTAQGEFRTADAVARAVRRAQTAGG